jgi:hypothetical protein
MITPARVRLLREISTEPATLIAGPGGGLHGILGSIVIPR